MSRTAPSGILFDLDNTLVHRGLSIESYAQRFEQDFGTRIIEPDSDAIAALIAERDNGGYGVAGSPFPTVREDIASALVADLHWNATPQPEELLQHWVTHFARHSIEMPGASAMLDRLLGANIQVGIVSNGMESSRRESVRHAGFDRRIHTLVSSERAGMRKPDARIFALAASELGVAAQRCWFVGDHPANDIEGARAAGMRPVWLAGFHAWPGGSVETTTIMALAEIAPLIRSSVG